MVFNNNLLLGAAGQGGGYTIDQSIRFNDDDSAYLTRTPGSASSHTTFTFSMWVKRCRTGSMRLFSTALGTSNKEDEIYFESNDRLQWQSYNGGFSYGFRLLSQAVYRDFSAWMHIVAVLDSTNGTAADRQRLYVNGERITAFDAEVQASASYASSINNTQAHYFSRYYASAVDLYDGYMAEINFIDGQALDPSSFGEVNSITGQWVPIEYTGSYGTNGFYITGEDSADLGADYSGNGNDFTSSGLTSADQMLDTPTDNFPTLNPLVPTSNTTLSDGNLVQVVSSAVGRTSRATIAIPEGKWVYEYTLVDTNDKFTIWGICREDTTPNEAPGTSATSYGFYVANGNKRNNTAGGGSAYGTAVTTAGKTVQIAVHRNGTSLKIWAGHDQSGSFVWQASGDPAADTNEMYDITINTSDVWFFAGGNDGNLTQTIGPVNFGQTGGFTYTPPTDFIALSTAALDDPTIALPTDYFQTVLDTGANIKTTAEALYTDQFEWIKDRDNTNNHQLIDSVRGTSAVLQSNTTAAETTYSAPSGNSVGWVWKANGTGSSNTDGSITSTVSADTTSGFSIVSYTATASAATVGHGLGVAPKMIIAKDRNIAGSSWLVYHTSTGATSYLLLNSANAAVTNIGAWNNTEPTSSVFSINNYHGASPHIAYCFAEVEGFSKFGSYTGNSSTDGIFVYCGFKPAFLFIKSSSHATSWYLFDDKRNPTNPSGKRLVSDANVAEDAGTTEAFDFLSNGFKLRNTSTGTNGSGRTYIFMAFAESSLKTATAR